MEVLIKRRRSGQTYVYITKSVMIVCYKLVDANDFLRDCTDCTSWQMDKLDAKQEVTVNLTGDAAEYFTQVKLRDAINKANKKVTSMGERKGCLH